MKVKYVAAQARRWAFMRYMDIPSKQNPYDVYLRRLRVIQTPWFSFYIHWINEADSDRHPHDHPWNFWSLVLKGGYTEEIYQDSRNIGESGRSEQHWRRFSWHKMPLSHAHKITRLPGETVTIVVTGRRVRQFRFWTDDGPVPWHEYLRGSGSVGS